MGTTSGGGRHAVGTSPARGPLFPVPRYPGFIWLLSFPLQRLPERFKSLLSAGFLPGNKPHPGGAERRKQSDGQRPNGAGSGAAASLPPSHPASASSPASRWRRPAHPATGTSQPSSPKGTCQNPPWSPSEVPAPGLALLWASDTERDLCPQAGGGTAELRSPQLISTEPGKVLSSSFQPKAPSQGLFIKKINIFFR